MIPSWPSGLFLSYVGLHLHGVSFVLCGLNLFYKYFVYLPWCYGVFMSIMELVGSVFSIFYGVLILFVVVFYHSYVKCLAPCSCPSYVFSSSCVSTLVFYFLHLKI